jgi:hypothetical protein
MEVPTKNYALVYANSSPIRLAAVLSAVALAEAEVPKEAPAVQYGGIYETAESLTRR